MASTISEYINKHITLLTCDGRLLTGTLLGYDQLQNLILKSSQEKIYSMDAPVEVVDLGLVVIRGDNVAVISDCDGEDNGDGGEEGDGGDAGDAGGGGGKGAGKGKVGGEEDDIRAEPIKPIVQNVT